MSNQLFTFQWMMSTNGFSVVPVQPSDLDSSLKVRGRGWVLTENSPRSLRRYKPLSDHPTLFRQFADLPLEGEAIGRFANQFGLLGTRPYPDPESDPQSARDEPHGELLSDWLRHIAALKDAVVVWDAVGTADEEALSKIKRSAKLFTRPTWYSGECMKFDPDDPDEDYHKSLDYEEAKQRLRKGRLLEVATTFVVDTVNQHMVGNGVAARLHLRPDGQDPDLYIVPRNLLGAMWLQLADAIDKKKEFRRCRMCNKPLEISTSPTGYRTNRRFCSDLCKVRHHQQKREKAVTLHAQGRPANEIAKQLGTTATIVRGWIRDANRPRIARRRSRTPNARRTS